MSSIYDCDVLECIVVAERSVFFLTSSLSLNEILQNRFFQLHNCNDHTVIKVHMDSQDDLNMTEARNSAENRRNRKIQTKSDDRILENAPKRVSYDMDMNVLLSRNNYLRFFVMMKYDKKTEIMYSKRTAGKQVC